MGRILSVVRRRVGLLDLSIRPTPMGMSTRIDSVEYSQYRFAGGSAANTLNTVVPSFTGGSSAKSWKIQVASNFDASFSTFLTVGGLGFSSSSVPNVGMYDSQTRGLVKITINPDDFTASFPAMADLKPFWLKVIPVDSAGADMTASGLMLVLPYSGAPSRAFNIAGSVGTGAVELLMPGTCSAMDTLVDSDKTLYLAYEPNGYEFKIPGITSTGGTDISHSFPAFSSMIVKGSASGTTFQTSLRILNNSVP